MTVRPLRDRIAVTKEEPDTAKAVAFINGRANDSGQVFPLDVPVRRSPRAPCSASKKALQISSRWAPCLTRRGRRISMLNLNSSCGAARESTHVRRVRNRSNSVKATSRPAAC
jgi:hypothetical protein